MPFRAGKYAEWIAKQDKNFVRLIHKNSKEIKKFKDDYFVPTNLKELELLDNEYIFEE